MRIQNALPILSAFSSAFLLLLLITKILVRKFLHKNPAFPSPGEQKCGYFFFYVAALILMFLVWVGIDFKTAEKFGIAATSLLFVGAFTPIAYVVIVKAPFIEEKYNPTPNTHQLEQAELIANRASVLAVVVGTVCGLISVVLG